METLEQIFVTDAFPEHTYVAAEEGKAEREFVEGLAVANKIISIVGPSKCGKTTLCQKYFSGSGGEDPLFTTGDAFDSIDEFWDLIFRKSPVSEAYPEHVARDQIIRLLAEDGAPVIVDDFHYTDRNIQRRLCQQMKNAAAQGLRFVILNTPHRGDDPIRNNPDLAGRFFTVDMAFWNSKNLSEIGFRGFKKLGVEVRDTIVGFLAKQSLGSPQLMQTLCLETGREYLNQDLPYEAQAIQEIDWTAVRQRAARSYNLNHLFTLLKNGPPRRGEPRLLYKLTNGDNGDVYDVIAYALASNPPFEAIEIDELRRRAKKILVDPETSPNFSAALDQLNNLFRDGPKPIEFDSEQRRIFITDPHFYFYLRTAVAELGLTQ